MPKHRSFSSLFNVQSKSINFKVGHFSPKYQGYSLTFWPKIAHCHHLSMFNQNQSISNLVIFHQNTEDIALLFGQKSLIFITFQCSIKINQFQIWSIFTKIPRLWPYFLAKNRSFSSLFNVQSKSINFKFGHLSQNQNTKAIALLFGQKLFRSFSSLFNVQSKSINFKFGHLSPKYQGYSLTFWPKIAHFHHFSMFNQNHSISNLVICHQNTKAIALLFGQKSLIFITFQCSIKINQFQIWSLFTKIPIAIALLFGQKSLIFITFQCSIKINQFQIWSFVTKIPRL